MNNSDIVFYRLKNQRLSCSEFNRPVEILHRLGAMQAQDFNSAKWALALRLRDTTNTLLEAAYNEGKILRTHLMRPTWHFVAPDDIRWLLQLTASRVNIACGSNYRKLELDQAVFSRCNKVLTRALQGSQYLTRARLKTVINQAGVEADDPIRLAHILLRAELDGVICSGPRLGNQFSYALLEERVAEAKILHREEALAKLTRRYFTSHGPATLQDFRWWSGLTMADAKNGLASTERQLTKILVAGEQYWTSKNVTPARQPLTSAHLLPAFDEYLVAYKNRKALLNESKSLRVDSGMLGPTIIIDGKIAGMWKHTNDGKSITISLKPFSSLNKAENLSVFKMLDRYATFLGLPVKLN